MDRKIDSFQSLLEQLRTIDEMPEHRVLKCETLFKLARSTESGAIVELGTYLGIGAISLYYGSHLCSGLPVYTIDDYADRTGWAGEKYSRENFQHCQRNFTTLSANVAQIVSGFREACETHLENIKIGLLVWDAGGFEAEGEIECFLPRIVSGGFVYLHDTADGKLGASKYINSLIKTKKYSGVYLRQANIIGTMKI